MYATLEEFFGTPTPDEIAKAPRLLISDGSVDMGRLKQNVASSKDVTIYNAGKSDLLIREVQGNCTCIKSTANKKVLKAGESTTLTIEFNPQNRQGTQQKRVTVYSNDPVNPVQAVTFTAYVGE